VHSIDIREFSEVNYTPDPQQVRRRARQQALRVVFAYSTSEASLACDDMAFRHPRVQPLEDGAVKAAGNRPQLRVTIERATLFFRT